MIVLTTINPEARLTMPDHDRSSMVKLWWWNPGGPQCVEIPFDAIDENRAELRASGIFYTWITASIPIRTNWRAAPRI